MVSAFTGSVFERELPHPLQSVLVALAQHVNKERAKAGDHRVWPSVDRLAWMLGLSYRTVQRRLRALEELGVIRLVAESGRRDARVYEIHLEALDVKAELTPRTKRRGDNRDAPQQPGRGDSGVLGGATPGAPGATLVVGRGDTAVSPEVEVNLNGTGKKEVPPNGQPPPGFFWKKQQDDRAQLEEKAKNGTLSTLEAYSLTAYQAEDG